MKLQPTPTLPIISITEFAKYMGCDPKRVRYLIEDGTITSVVKDASSVVTGVLWREAQEEWSDVFDPTNERPSAQLLERMSDINSGGAVTDGIRAVAESKKIEAHYKADMARVALEREKGILVEAVAVKKQLHQYGVEVRLAVQGIADAVVDDVLAETDRTKAYRMIRDACDEALNKLTEVVERDFTI